MTNPIFYFALKENITEEFLPKQSTEHATGYDVRAAIKTQMIISPFEYVKIPLGFRCFLPEGWWLDLRPRSSTFVKKHFNSLYGTIDEDFEGEFHFCAQYIPNNFKQDGEFKLIIEPGEKIGQLVPVERKIMNVVSVSNEILDKLFKDRDHERGAGGFGSTGDK